MHNTPDLTLAKRSTSVALLLLLEVAAVAALRRSSDRRCRDRGSNSQSREYSRLSLCLAGDWPIRSSCQRALLRAWQ